MSDRQKRLAFSDLSLLISQSQSSHNSFDKVHVSSIFTMFCYQNAPNLETEEESRRYALREAANRRNALAEDRSKLMIVSRKRRVLINGNNADTAPNITYDCSILKLPDVSKSKGSECSETPFLQRYPSQFVPSYSSGYAIESPMLSRVPLVLSHHNIIHEVQQQLTSILKCPPASEFVSADDDRKTVRFRPTVIVQYFDDNGPIYARRGLLHNDAIRKRRVTSSCFRRRSSASKRSHVVSATKRRGVSPAILAVTRKSSPLPSPSPPTVDARRHLRSSVCSLPLEGSCASEKVRPAIVEYRAIFGKRQTSS